MKELNKVQVVALFVREAVLIGSEDRVPEYRAAALFGKEAVEHARSMDRATPGRYFNGYGVGSSTMFYLTFQGSQAPSSFHNVQILREEARA